jgi:hypothetical protein
MSALIRLLETFTKPITRRSVVAGAPRALEGLL